MTSNLPIAATRAADPLTSKQPTTPSTGKPIRSLGSMLDNGAYVELYLAQARPHPNLLYMSIPGAHESAISSLVRRQQMA